MKTAKEILKNTRNILEEFGWTKGTTYNRNTGECCLIGALAIEHEGGKIPDDSVFNESAYDIVDRVEQREESYKEAFDLIRECGTSKLKSIGKITEDEMEYYEQIEPSGFHHFNDYVGEEGTFEVLDCAIGKAK